MDGTLSGSEFLKPKTKYREVTRKNLTTSRKPNETWKIRYGYGQQPYYGQMGYGQMGGYYPPPPPPQYNGGQTTIIEINDSNDGTQCRFCTKTTSNYVRRKTGTTACLWGVAMFPCCLCCIPCCMDGCKDV